MHINWNDATTQVVASLIGAAVVGAATWVWKKRQTVGEWLASRPWAVALATAFPTSAATTVAIAVVFGIAAPLGTMVHPAGQAIAVRPVRPERYLIRQSSPSTYLSALKAAGSLSQIWRMG